MSKPAEMDPTIMEERLSNCCGASDLYDGNLDNNEGVCADCGEHCEMEANQMTNYNERLDEVLWSAIMHEPAPTKPGEEYKATWNEPVINKAKQAITSLMKELVAEAKPYRETIIDKWNKDRADEVKATNAAMNAWADIYEQNLLKALEEV